MLPNSTARLRREPGGISGDMAGTHMRDVWWACHRVWRTRSCR